MDVNKCKITYKHKIQFKYAKIVRGEFVSIAKLDSDDFGCMVAVSKKFGNAVARNLIKRHVKSTLLEYSSQGLYKITLTTKYVKYAQLVKDVLYVLNEIKTTNIN